MVLVNIKRFAKIECNKKFKVVQVGSVTKLTAHFKCFDWTENEKVTPIWVVECENAEDYMIETSNNDRCLEITALKYHDGAIIKVSLIDEEL